MRIHDHPFTDENTEARDGVVTCPGSQSGGGAEGTWLRCPAGLSVRVDSMCPVPPQHVGGKIGAEGRSEQISGGWGIPEGLHVGRALKLNGGFLGKVGLRTGSAVTSTKEKVQESRGGSLLCALSG